MSSIQKKVRDAVADLVALDVNVVTLEATLASLDCDDLAVEIAEVMEAEFDLDTIDENVAEGWRIVSDICRYVEKYAQ